MTKQHLMELAEKWRTETKKGLAMGYGRKEQKAAADALPDIIKAVCSIEGLTQDVAHTALKMASDIIETAARKEIIG